MKRLSYKFPKSSRLLTRRDYRRVATRSERLIGRFLLIHYRFDSHKRLGLVVSRRYGHSTQRNRFKRQVREAFRLHFDQIPDGAQLVIRPRRAALKASSCEIAEELLFLLHDCSHSLTEPTATSSR